MNSNSRPPVAARPQVRERPRPPPPAVAEAEKQWIFTEDELLRTPSLVDGMSVEEERALRKKGVNFILQVGYMLKLPQTTLFTASVFLNRFIMRHSLVPKPGYKPLHHFVSLPSFPRATAKLILLTANRCNFAVPCHQS